MGTKIYQVDAFADEPFQGNPAAVCLLDEPREERWMQAVAMELNLSETAFLVREGDLFHLRWFTPKAEVALCGHATLASAHVLWEEGILEPSQAARFLTRSGELMAAKKDGLIELDFPAKPEGSSQPPEGLAEALGVRPLYVGRNAFDYLALVENEETVRSLAPDFRALGKVQARGVVVTSPASTAGFDFISRFFAPAVGVDEDPVTGSAHCCLGPFWKDRLGKAEMIGYQASRRGGVVRVRVAGDRVLLGGRAIAVLSGTLSV